MSCPPQQCLPPRGRVLNFVPTGGPMLLLGESEPISRRHFIAICPTIPCVGPRIPQETTVFFAPRAVPRPPGPGPRPGPGPSPGPTPQPGPPEPPAPEPGDEFVTTSFLSDLRNCELCGFNEFTSPSTPPKKYHNRGIQGSLSKTVYQDLYDCAVNLPSFGTVAWQGNIPDSPDTFAATISVMPVSETETTVTYEITFSASQLTGTPVASRGVLGGVPISSPTFAVATKGQTFQVSVEWNAIYWHGICPGSCITIMCAPPPQIDNWNIQESYGISDCIFSQSLIATRTWPGPIVTNLVDYPNISAFVSAGQPQFCYPPYISMVTGPNEPIWIGTSAPTQTNRTTFGLGCVNNPFQFGGRSIQSIGTVSEDLTIEDTEAMAIARGTPILGASNVARYEARAAFNFVYETVEFDLDAAGLVSGNDYTITVPLVTESYGGGGPVASSLTFNFTAAGITHNINYTLVAPRGKQVTVGVATIVGASIAPTLINPTIQADGDTWSFGFSEPVTFGVGGSTGFVVTASGGAVTLSYVSGAGTDTLLYSGSRTMNYDETATLAYTNPGNGIKDATGLALANFSGLVVTNDSAENQPPTLISATLESDGETWAFLFSEVVSFGAGGNAGFAVTAEFGAVSLSYLSGSGTNTLRYTGSRQAHANETITLAYTQPGSGVENAAAVDLATFSGQSVVNDSGLTGFYATGGIVTVSGGIRRNTFATSGSLVVHVAGTPDILLAGGAGGGGGGGGGAGGFKKVIAHALAVGTYAVTVGVGGASSTVYTGAGSEGSPGTGSSIDTLSVDGGGYGGGVLANFNGGPGASGGGASQNGAGSGVGGAGTPGQGNDGGDCTGGWAGGGGGSAAPGADGSASDPGDGGAGTLDDIVDPPEYFCAGGGASAGNISGIGGSFPVGASGATNLVPATTPTPNRGGGGGGRSSSQVSSPGADGTVIVASPL